MYYHFFNCLELIILLFLAPPIAINHICLPSICIWILHCPTNQQIKVVRKIHAWGISWTCSILACCRIPAFITSLWNTQHDRAGSANCSNSFIISATFHNTTHGLYYKNKYYSLIVSVQVTPIYHLNDHKPGWVGKYEYFVSVICKNPILPDSYLPFGQCYKYSPKWNVINYSGNF